MTSHRRPDCWVVPGGGIEPQEEPRNAAMREAMEEAGVRGRIGRQHGIFEVSLIFKLCQLSSVIHIA